MRYITEQELQVRFREEKIQKFNLMENERLTPGARQFLSDHQIAIIECEGTFPNNQSETTALLAVSESKRETLFPLLELELWEAALKAAEISRAYKEKILFLVQLVKAIQTDDFTGLQLDAKTAPQNEVEIEIMTIKEELIFQPNGKIIIKLQRASVYATALQSCVSKEQKIALAQIILFLRQEIYQLEQD